MNHYDRQAHFDDMGNKYSGEGSVTELVWVDTDLLPTLDRILDPITVKKLWRSEKDAYPATYPVQPPTRSQAL